MPAPQHPSLDADARTLLDGYRRVREQVASGGLIVSAGRARGLRPLVLYGLDDRVTKRAALLKRRAHAHTVETGADHSAILGTLDHLLASLPPVPYRRLYAALVLAVSAAALGVIGLLRQLEQARSLDRTLKTADDLVHTLAARILTIDIGQIPDALGALGHKDPRVLAFAAIIVALALYAILRPFAGTFRVRAALLEGELEACEERVLGRIREVPFDLIVYALPMTLPLYLGLYMVGDGIASGEVAEAIVGALLLALPASARLAVLHRRWRRREQAAEPAPLRSKRFAMAEEGSNPVRV